MPRSNSNSVAMQTQGRTIRNSYWWTLVRGFFDEAALHFLDRYGLRECGVVAVIVDGDSLALVLLEEDAVKYRSIVVYRRDSFVKS
jgi:hypothetical protein